MSTRETMPRHHWKHEVIVRAVAGGANAEWIKARFETRLGIWFNAGETIDGAVEMILFTHKREPIETRGDREFAFLQSTLKRK